MQMSWVMSHEPAVRLGFFAGVFVMMAIWELIVPRRRRSASSFRPRRSAWRLSPASVAGDC
jgi:hypothetical protein